jgi:stage II sporulation protein D
MLKPNEIPEKEPEIRVGIILPEDRCEHISVTIPQEYPCTLKDARKESAVVTGITLTFVKSENIISLNKFEKSSFWHITPDVVYPLSARIGIIVKSVIAGRGFHWQKKINLYLSGSLQIRVVNGYLFVINILPLEQYIACVATSEMSAQCPDAFLQAQTIAARSWLLANIEQKHAQLGIDVCNDDCCQRYQGNGNLSNQAIAATVATAGYVLMHQQNICDCRYSKSCGGRMETFANVWQGPEQPYLQSRPDAPEKIAKTFPVLDCEESVETWIDTSPPCYCSPAYVPENELLKYLGSVDEETHYYRWQIRQARPDLVQTLNQTLKLNIKKILSFTPISRGPSGRINKLQICFQDKNGNTIEHVISGEYTIRKSLYSGFLYSSCFYIEPDALEDSFIIKGAGWGHGVGLCQIGALGMALHGISCKKILSHYYRGTTVTKIY